MRIWMKQPTCLPRRITEVWETRQSEIIESGADAMTQLVQATENVASSQELQTTQAEEIVAHCAEEVRAAASTPQKEEMTCFVLKSGSPGIIVEPMRYHVLDACFYLFVVGYRLSI